MNVISNLKCLSLLLLSGSLDRQPDEDVFLQPLLHLVDRDVLREKEHD